MRGGNLSLPLQSLPTSPLLYSPPRRIASKLSYLPPKLTIAFEGPEPHTAESASSPPAMPATSSTSSANPHSCAFLPRRLRALERFHLSICTVDALIDSSRSQHSHIISNAFDGRERVEGEFETRGETGPWFIVSSIFMKFIVGGDLQRRSEIPLDYSAGLD